MLRAKNCHRMNWVALAVIVLFCPASTAQAALISHWTFDAGSGQSVADSVGVNHGTLGATGSVAADDPVWSASGKFGGAVDVDGTDDLVLVPHHATLNFTSVRRAA